MSKIKVGDVFRTNGGSDCEVLEYIHSKNILVVFKDKYKHQMRTSSTHLNSGSVKNPYQPNVCGKGFVGVGKHKASNGKECTPEYLLWKRMIYRCYDQKSLEKQPSYRGCSVCDEWLNFQNFAEWINNNPYKDFGYELDKDLIYQGNKIYSPDTCCLVPKEINTILNDCRAVKGKYPIGVTFSKIEKKFTATMRVNGKRKHLGYFKTSESAHKVYIKSKKKHISNTVRKYKGKIDERVITALNEWSFI